jgi:hypothetical protein
MSRENYVSVGCDCSQWCVSDLCWCGCAGDVAGVAVLVMLLVWLCWWCCWCGCAGDVAGRLGSWSTSFTHSDPFISSPWVVVPWHLPACTWWLSYLLAGWLGRPAWSLADILRVSHVDKINCLMIINSVFPLICYCHLYYPWWHFSWYFLCLQVTKNNREERKERMKIKVV